MNMYFFNIMYFLHVSDLNTSIYILQGDMIQFILKYLKTRFEHRVREGVLGFAKPALTPQ